MPQSFGDQLKLFALSIDVVDDDRFNKVGEMINDYCEKVLNIQHTRVFLKDSVEGQPGLAKYKLGSKEKGSARRVQNGQGLYNGQSCFAFDKMCSLWIVSTTKAPLSESEGYIDLWSQTAGIPPYRPIQEDSTEDNTKMKTSIILPIERRQKLLGVVNFETTEYLEITSEAKSELKKIAETIYILRSLLAGSQRQQRNTDSAMDQLQNNLKRSQPKLTKPKIFLASSARAKTDVIEIIKSVLKECGDSIALEYWKENETPGNMAL